MINGAERWKVLFDNEDILPEGSVRLYTDLGYQKIDGGVTTNGEAEGSGASNTIGNSIDYGVASEPTEYATLEHNFWLLDGTFDYVDNVEQLYTNNNRYVSEEICNSGGTFANYPTITYHFANAIQGSNAITVRWNSKLQEYSPLLNVSKVGYGSSTGLVGKNDYNTFTVAKTSSGSTYNAITITIRNWSMPYRRARIIQVWDGIRLHIDKQKISKFKISKSADILSGSLPMNELTVEVFDIENEFDLDSGFYKDVLENTKWVVDAGIKIDKGFDWILLGYYYMQVVTRPKNGLTAQFVMEDILSKITGKFPAEIQGAMTDPYVWSTWRELFAKISDLTGVTINIKSGYYLDDTAAGYPTQRTYRTQIELTEWLQTVANGAKTIIKTNVGDEINITSLIKSDYSFVDTVAVDKLLLFNAYDYPEIEKLAQIKDCSLTGYKPADDSVQYTFVKQFNDIGVSQTATNNRIRFSESSVSPLYTFPAEFADGYNQWVYTFINNAKRLTGTSRMNPGLELFDLIEVETKAGNTIKGYLTFFEIEYTGSFKGKYTVYAPQGQN